MIMGIELDWPAWLAKENDLDKVASVLAREEAIRRVMAESGESREIVAEMLDAAESMDQEAVLDLMEGQPTTLRAALSRWLELVAPETLAEQPRACKEDLAALLDYPYPGEEALIELHGGNHSTELEIQRRKIRGGDDEIIVKVGGTEIGTVTEYDCEGVSGNDVEEMIQAVHRAVLARVIPDRDHHVQLSSTDRRSLLAWLERPNGSWLPDDRKVRVSLDAVEGGGVLVRTRPYRHQRPADQPMRSRVAADAYRDGAGGYAR